MPNSYKKKKKKVYIALSGDILHHGHINLINKAKKVWRSNYWVAY